MPLYLLTPLANYFILDTGSTKIRKVSFVPLRILKPRIKGTCV